MSNQHGLALGQFMGDDGGVHDMVPSSVIAAVPEAKAAAERYGREVRFDFLDDHSVHWLLFHRWEDNRKWRVRGCLASIPETPLLPDRLHLRAYADRPRDDRRPVSVAPPQPA